MALNLLSVENISKSFGERELFENLTFGVAQGEKLAMVARNGAGKSTLLNMLTGKELPDSGTITFRRDVRVGVLLQDAALPGHLTVAEAIFEGGSDALRTVREYELALDNPAQHHLLEALAAKMEEQAAWDLESKVKQVLFQLNIRNLQQPIQSLSGGQKKRVALAALLIAEPDFMILDEPTNHLDLDMIEWLEGYLSRSNLTLLMVTHDRHFLDNVATSILEMDGGTLFRYDGDYAYFLEKKEERESSRKSEQDKARNILRRELEWVRRMPKARGTKSKSRLDAYENLKASTTTRKQGPELELNVKMNRIGGKVLEMKKVYKAFDGQPILKGFDYTFKTGERIGIVGKNGVGKTTFLDLIMGLQQPDSGKINRGETVVFGYYAQEGLLNADDKRVIDVVKDSAEVIQLADGSKVSAGQFLNLFQFPNEQQYTLVRKLSGGEKRRLFLLTVLMKNPNFLILDEPTNDLDLLTLNILEEFLFHYKGCLLVVSHDRYFMNKLVDHLFVFEGEGQVKDFNGSYEEYRSRKTLSDEAVPKATSGSDAPKAMSVKSPNTAKTKLSFKEKFELEQLEKEIPQMESEKADVESRLGAGLDHQTLLEMTDRLGTLTTLLEEKSMRWLELSEKAEASA